MYHSVVYAFLLSVGAKPVVRQGRKATGFSMKQPGCFILNRLPSKDRPVFLWDAGTEKNRGDFI
jgi:hypothetical protein